MPFASLDTASLRSSVPSTDPPSYSRHFQDELLSPPALRNNNPAVFGVRTRPLLTTNQHHMAQMLQTLTSNDPLVLTVDKNLLYPPPPSTALYHLPRVLTWSGNEIFLFRSLPVSATRSSRDLALYTMRRTPFTHEIVLIPRREGLKAAKMRGKRRGVLGTMTWQVEVKGQVLLSCSKGGRWKDSQGKVVAAERHARATDTREDPAMSSVATEEIIIEGDGVEVWLKDLVVAAWCSRIWQSKSRSSLASRLRKGQGELPTALPESLLMRIVYEQAPMARGS